MKPLRPAIAAATAVALLGVYLWDLRRTETAAILAIQGERVLFMVPSLVDAVTFNADDGPIELVRDESTRSWRIVSPRELPANDVIVEAYLENLRGARRHAVVDNRTAAQAGLDDPRRTVTVVFRDERTNRQMTRTLEFGHQPDEFSKVFARIRGEDTIFTVSDWIYRQAGKSLQDLRGLDAFATDLAGAERIDVRSRRGSYSISRPGTSSQEWVITEEGRDAIPADRAMIDRMMVGLGAARFASIHDTVTSSTLELGLEPPLLEIQVDGEPLLLVGNRVGELEQFIVQTAGGTIGNMPGSHLIDMFRPAAEWGSKQFSWIRRQDISEIYSVLGNTRHTLQRTDEGWIFKEMPGVAVRQDAVETFLDGIAAYRGGRMVAADVAPEAHLSHGIHPESYRVEIRAADGRVHGLHFGRMDTREGITNVLRIQDNTLWAVPARSQALVYRYRSDFEERRVAPGLAERTDHIEIFTPHGTMNFQRTQAAWRVTMPGERPVVVAPSMVGDFLQAFQDMETQAEMISNDTFPAEITFSFYETNERDAFLTAGILMRSQTTGNTIFRIQKPGQPSRSVEINAEQLGTMDTALTELLVAAKARAEQERR